MNFEKLHCNHPSKARVIIFVIIMHSFMDACCFFVSVRLCILVLYGFFLLAVGDILSASAY